MKVKMTGKVGAALCALLAVLFFFAEAHSQQRRRASRRTTNPVPTRNVAPAPTPLPAEPTVVRTAEDVAAQEEAENQPRRRTTSRTRRTGEQDAEPQDTLRSTVNKLSETVTNLSNELSELKGEQRILVDLERLTRAEQRAEGLRTQLRDVTDKEFMLQDRLAQIEEEIQPGAIERRTAVYGTLNPAALREQVRLSLERERERIQRQLEMLSTSRVRLESAIASADQEVERIKRRLEDSERKQADADAKANASGEPTPTTQPTPPPSDNPPAEPPKE